MKRFRHEDMLKSKRNDADDPWRLNDIMCNSGASHCAIPYFLPLHRDNKEKNHERGYNGLRL